MCFEKSMVVEVASQETRRAAARTEGFPTNTLSALAFPNKQGGFVDMVIQQRVIGSYFVLDASLRFLPRGRLPPPTSHNTESIILHLLPPPSTLPRLHLMSLSWFSSAVPSQVRRGNSEHESFFLSSTLRTPYDFWLGRDFLLNTIHFNLRIASTFKQQ